MRERIIDHAAALGIQKGSLTTGIRRATLELDRLFPKSEDLTPEATAANPEGPRPSLKRKRPATP